MAMSTMHQGMTSQAERLTELENALVHERLLRANQKEIIERLSKELEDATARVERLSTGLAAKRSRRDDQLPYLAPNHPPVLAQTEQVVLVQPRNLHRGQKLLLATVLDTGRLLQKDMLIIRDVPGPKHNHPKGRDPQGRPADPLELGLGEHLHMGETQ